MCDQFILFRLSLQFLNEFLIYSIIIVSFIIRTKLNLNFIVLILNIFECYCVLGLLIPLDFFLVKCFLLCSLVVDIRHESLKRIFFFSIFLFAIYWLLINLNVNILWFIWFIHLLLKYIRILLYFLIWLFKCREFTESSFISSFFLILFYLIG